MTSPKGEPPAGTPGAAEQVLHALSWSSFSEETQVQDALVAARCLWSEEKDEHRTALLRTLATVLELRFDGRETSECPFWQMDRVDALDPQLLRELAEVAEQVPAMAVRGQLLDVAWYRRVCNHRLVEVAVDAYCQHAKAILDPKRWSTAFQLLCRAAALAATLGRGKPLHARVLVEIGNVALGVGENDPLCLCAKLMSLLQQYRYPDVAKFASLAERIAAKALEQGDYQRAKSLLEVKERWHQIGKDPASERATRIRIAEVLQDLAEDRASRGEYLLAAAHQTEAVEAWRRVGNAAEDIRRSRVRLQELQRRSVGTLRRYERSVDLSGSVAHARAAVTGKPAFDAIVALILLQGPIAIADLIQMAKERLQNSITSSIFAHQDLSSAGRTVHRRKGLLGEDVEDALLDEARKDLATIQQLLALGAVAPAAQQIYLEHGLTTSDMLGLATRSPFVPPRRGSSFARGLVLGFQGDFVLAAHLLMPQFENAVRRQLELCGAVVSTLPSSGEQNELDLNALLDLPEAEQFFGRDELFELQSFLVEKAGTNLRNELAHGLKEDGQSVPSFIYFWWKVLRFVVLPFVRAAPRANDGEESDSFEPPDGGTREEVDVGTDERGLE